MNERILKDMDTKLDSLVRLLALQLAAGRKQADAIELLSAAGLEPRRIAPILGTTSNTVRVRLAELRKRKRRS